jgi:hypothetical protein
MGRDSAMEEMENVYKQIADSHKNNMELITDIANNRAIASEVTTIAVNDLHLSKSFTKSLRNVLHLEARIALPNGDKLEPIAQ